MRLVTQNFHVHISSQSTAAAPEPPHPMPEATGSFPIIAIALVGILATAFLLVSYYVFAIKCCLTWRIDLLHGLSFSRRGHHTSTALLAEPADARSRRGGLDDSAIRSIPVFLFRAPDPGAGPSECAVCLAEFRDGEKLRRMPNCDHVFHIDCIDVWLQGSANCPLCRTSISGCSAAIWIQFDPTFAPDPPPRVPDPDPRRLSGHGVGDFMVIELGGDSSNDGGLCGARVHGNRNMRKVYSIGDEIIDFRVKDERFVIQPVRRSFSLDSSKDPMFYKSIQEIAQQHVRCGDESEGCSSIRSSLLPVNLG